VSRHAPQGAIIAPPLAGPSGNFVSAGFQYAVGRRPADLESLRDFLGATFGGHPMRPERGTNPLPIGFPLEVEGRVFARRYSEFLAQARMALRPRPFHARGTTARRQMRAKKPKIDKCSACRGTGVIKVEGASFSGRQQLPRCPRCEGTGIATAKSHTLDGWTTRPGQLPSGTI
jgi:hypothetical protein